MITITFEGVLSKQCYSCAAQDRNHSNHIVEIAMAMLFSIYICLLF